MASFRQKTKRLAVLKKSKVDVGVFKGGVVSLIIPHSSVPFLNIYKNLNYCLVYSSFSVTFFFCKTGGTHLRVLFFEEGKKVFRIHAIFLPFQGLPEVVIFVAERAKAILI